MAKGYSRTVPPTPTSTYDVSVSNISVSHTHTWTYEAYRPRIADRIAAPSAFHPAHHASHRHRSRVLLAQRGELGVCRQLAPPVRGFEAGKDGADRARVRLVEAHGEDGEAAGVRERT